MAQPERTPPDPGPDAAPPTGRRASAQTGWESLEPYVQLLRVLLPRMTGCSVFNAHGEMCWSSEMALDAQMRKLIQESLKLSETDPVGAGQLVDANIDEPVYLFWLRDTAADAPSRPYAIVALRCRPVQNTERSSFEFVLSLVRPAMECLRRELQSREEILGLHNSLAAQDHDLDMVLAVSGADQPKGEDSGDELRAILRSAAEHIAAGLVALIVPEKGLALVQQASEQPLDNSLVAKAHRHLLSTAQLQKDAVIVNRIKFQAESGAGIYRLLSCPIVRADGRAMGVLALFRAEAAPEFTARHSRLAELLARRIATAINNSYDALTGLLTRPAFENKVRGVLNAARSAQRWWSALYIDTNRMHVINDTYGMHTGDRVLTQIGELVRRRLPPGALAARISGDRYAVLLPASLQDAAAFAESLRVGAEQIGSGMGDGKMSVSISIGVAALEPRNVEFNHAFAAAEMACKAANDRGRNRVELFQEADESIVKRFTDINVVGDLRDAIAEGRMRLVAQMVVGLSGGRHPPHFEILLRMLNPAGETVGPSHFLSAANRYQMMPEIDRWVIAEALAQLKPHAALLANADVIFTINCSGQSLKDEAFTEHVAGLIENSGINPAALCFELTESAAIGDLAHAEKLMHRLRKLGCGIALDDFGTGLSSLAYLRSLPITMLKIDGSFVRDVLRDAKAESMVQAIAQLARAMSLTTVAEFVETEEIRNRIATLGVDYGQGFAFGQATPLAEVLDQLPLYVAAGQSAA